MKNNVTSYDLYKRYITKIPSFISTTNRIHKAIYDEMFCVNTEFKSLFSNSILTKPKLQRINSNIERHLRAIDELLVITEDQQEDELDEYYLNLFTDILEYAIEQEEFEVAQNISTYSKIYGSK